MRVSTFITSSPRPGAEATTFPPALCDSIVNKAALTARTNRMIGGNAPSDYLRRLEKSAGVDTARLDQLLQSHLADGTIMRRDAFDEFFESRRRALLARIEVAMGKAVMREALPEETNGGEFEEESEADFQETAL